MDDKDLERLAQEELLAEVKRGKIREETMGMLAWKKSPVPRPNKRFLTNMLMSTREPKRKKTESKESDKDSRHGGHSSHHKKKSKPSDDDKRKNKPSNSKQEEHPDKSRKQKHKKKRTSER